MSDHTASADALTRFLLETAGVRGVHVRLEQTWLHIRERIAYPAAVAELLGETVAASALFTGHAKVDGRLSIQLRGDGALRTVFAECTGAGTLRGIARFDDDAPPASPDLRELGEDALLAVTIENPGMRANEPARYQGLVALDTDSLAAAFENYFQQSEQLPTRLRLAVSEGAVAGLMLQKLPGDEGDLDGWARVGALFETLGAEELLAMPASTLLHRLFHEDGVRQLGGRPLRFACSCSRARVSAMLETLGETEALAAATDNQGVAEIRCQFCGEAYRFAEAEIAALFAARPAPLEAPERLQ